MSSLHVHLSKALTACIYKFNMLNEVFILKLENKDIDKEEKLLNSQTKIYQLGLFQIEEGSDEHKTHSLCHIPNNEQTDKKIAYCPFYVPNLL